MKVKLIEVAKRAGVGHATVDRVLNERGGVAPATAKRVLDAARELGLGRSLPTLYRTSLRFEVLLGRKDIPLFARINDAFARLIPTVSNIVIQRTFVDDTKPERVALAIRKSRCNAIIVYGQEHEAVIDAIAAVTSAGTPVVTMVSDLPTAPRLGYVGIDHYAAGRAAAFFMARMAGRPGEIIVICNGFHYRAHAERVSGFRDGLADYGKGGGITDIIEGKDDERLTHGLLMDAISRAVQLVGIYNAGTINSAVERAISMANFIDAPVLIGHDLTADTIRMLQRNVMTLVIDQNPELQVRHALDILCARFGLAVGPENDQTVPFTIHVKDNV